MATRRLDRLRQTVTLFNSGPRPVQITDVSSRPNDPSLRVRYSRGDVLPPFTVGHCLLILYQCNRTGYTLTAPPSLACSPRHPPNLTTARHIIHHIRKPRSSSRMPVSDMA